MSFKRKVKRQHEKGHKTHMALTMGELVNGSAALQMLAGQALPGPLALKVARLTRQVGPELEAYNVARLDIFKRHGDPSEDNKQYTLRDGKDAEDANAELKALWESDVPVDFTPLPAKVLDHIEISAELLNAAQWLFQEE